MDFIEPCFGIGHNLSLICQMTSEDIKHQLIIRHTCVFWLAAEPRRDQEQRGGAGLSLRVQGLRESRGGRPGLSVLTSIMVSVDVKTTLNHASALSLIITSTDIRGHKALLHHLCSHSRMDCLSATLLLNSCFSDTVFVTLLRTAVKTTISEVDKLLRTGGVPTSLTLLFSR